MKKRGKTAKWLALSSILPLAAILALPLITYGQPVVDNVPSESTYSYPPADEKPVTLFLKDAERDILYVNPLASVGGNGTSWEHAFTHLQSALKAAEYGNDIWVASGSYTPVHPGSSGERTDSFHMRNGVGIFGGFPSTGSPNWGQRDWETCRTVLSGEIGNPGTASDNCYHVFYHPDGLGLDNTAILDGFIITGGFASGPGAFHVDGGGMHNRPYNSPSIRNCLFTDNSAQGDGGGIFNDTASPTIMNCTFSFNRSGYFGGGIGNYYHSNAAISGCTFRDNRSPYGGGVCNNYYSSAVVTNSTFVDNVAESGAGLHNHCDSNATITGCRFIDNYGSESGAGMANGSCVPTINGCVFSGNQAAGNDLNGGGGMYNYGSSSPTITNSIFATNTTSNFGGGIYNHTSGAPVIVNCTIFGNTAKNNGGAVYNRESSPSIINSILWNNSSQYSGDEIYNWASSAVVTYCDIAGGYQGEGNISGTPMFLNPVIGDFHLLPSSPCIDAGSNSAMSATGIAEDFEGDDRIVCHRVDMGVDEWSVQSCYDRNDTGKIEYAEMVDALTDYLSGDLPYGRIICVLMAYLTS